MPVLVKASVVLFLAAEVLIFVALGWDAVFLAVTWAIVAAAAAGAAVFVHGAAVRVTLATLLVAGCVLFATELGLFFLPAAATLLAAAVSEHQHYRIPHGGR